MSALGGHANHGDDRRQAHALVRVCVPVRRRRSPMLPCPPVLTGPAESRRAVLGVIPARYGASRFPGKPLAMLWGKPMLQHVWERARAAKGLDELVVATDDERIASAARSWGASVEMTSPECASGTDRVAEVARRRANALIVLNLQGDEPELETGAVTRLVAAMRADDTVTHGDGRASRARSRRHGLGERRESGARRSGLRALLQPCGPRGRHRTAARRCGTRACMLSAVTC